MPLDKEVVARIRKMGHDELVANAVTVDAAVMVEASLRLQRTMMALHRTTWVLNAVLIALTLVIAWDAGTRLWH